MLRQTGRIILTLFLCMLLPVGCGTPVYLVDRATHAKVRCTANLDCDQVGIPAIEESPKQKIVARDATFRELRGKEELLDYSTLEVLTASESGDSPPPDSLMRVHGRRIPASAWENGALGLALWGGGLLAAGLIGAGFAIYVASPKPFACSSSECMNQDLAKVAATGIGVGSGVLFGIPGIIMLSFGVSRHGKQQDTLRHLQVMNTP